MKGEVNGGRGTFLGVSRFQIEKRGGHFITGFGEARKGKTKRRKKKRILRIKEIPFIQRGEG